MAFKQWSEINPDVNKDLKLDLGIRGWDKLNTLEKERILIYLKNWLFDPDLMYLDHGHKYSNERGLWYPIIGNDQFEVEKKANRICKTIHDLNQQNKAKSFGSRFLKKNKVFEAFADFHSIWMNNLESVVYELISIYAKNLIIERQKDEPFWHGNKETVAYQKHLEIFRWQLLDEFAKDLNEVFLQFHLNVQLSRVGLFPLQEEKITEEIYLPVLKILSDSKWIEVNRILSDAFLDYRKNTDQGYSSSVTNSIAAIQAFLQIIVNGNIGKGDIGELIAKATKNKLIPDDKFSNQVLKVIQSFFMQERQETGIAHPKIEYATEKNARLVLNLTMVFLQHCIQN